MVNNRHARKQYRGPLTHTHDLLINTKINGRDIAGGKKFLPEIHQAASQLVTPITKEALHGLFLFMPSEFPVCYSYLAAKQHPAAHAPNLLAAASRERARAWAKCSDSTVDS